MGYSPEYRKSAEKYLDGQTQSVRLRIMDAVMALPVGNVRKLRGREGYRLVVGDFRIIFNYTDKVTDDGNRILDVIAIGSRGDIYKK